MMRKIKKWIIIVSVSLLVVALIISAIVENYFGDINDINFKELFSGIVKEEQQQIDIAHKAHYERIANIASYGMFSNAGDRNQSLFSKLLESAKESHPDIFRVMDFNDKYIHDANNNKVVNLKQLKAFDSLGDAEQYFRDADNREETYNILDAETLFILNNELFEDGNYEDNGERIINPEQFTKPVAFVYDYKRVDKEGNDYIYLVERDEEGNVISEPEGKIYDYIVGEVNSNDYYKQVKGTYSNLPLSYELEEETVENEYSNEYRPLKKKYFDIDENGNPIVPEGETPPRKHMQLVPLANEYGQVVVKSMTKYNVSSKQIKKAIIDDNELTEFARELYNSNPSKYRSSSVYDGGYSIAYREAKEIYEAEKLSGIENVDWEWDYQGEFKNLGEMQNDGSLKYSAKEEDFRYVYHDKKVYDRVYYDFSSGKPVKRTNPDNSYEFKNLEYAWDFSKDKAVYKINGEELPMELKSVKDYGLGLISTYIEAVSVEFMQALAVDEERDNTKLYSYLRDNYNSAFTEASNGFYPIKIEEEDEDLRKETFNEDLLEYVGEMSEKHSTSVQIGNVGQDLAIGSRVNQLSFSNTDKYDDLIVKYSTRYNVDPKLIKAMIAQESSGNANDSSGWGWGLGQIEDTRYGKGTYPWNRQIIAPNGEVVDMWITGDISTDDRLDPEKNIRWITAHLGSLVKTYNGDNLKALVAYNAGSGAMSALLKAYPDNWIQNIDKIPQLLGKTAHGDSNYIMNVLSYYNGNDYKDISLPVAQGFSGGSISSLINENTIDSAGNFIGVSGFDNEEFNSKIQLKTPYIESSLFNKVDIKDQAVNPEKYYHYWYDKINQDNSKLEFWMPAVANIADKINKGVFKDSGVNSGIDFSKYSHNEKIEEKKAEISAKGEVIYTNPSMTRHLYLIDEATNFVGTFMHTYRDQTRITRPLSDNESKAVVDLYEVGRHWVADRWNITLNIEETRYRKVEKIDENGVKYTDTEPYSYDTSVTLPSIDVDLEIYQEEIIPLNYTESDMGRTLLTNGFIPNSDYKQTYSVEVPTVSSRIIDNYNFERGTVGETNYLSSTVTGIDFELEVIDNRNNGELKEVYRHYYGGFYETRPYEENVYFEDELMSDWRQRMTLSSDMTSVQERRVERETEGTLSYLEDYIRNFEADIPNQVIKDWNAFDRTEDYYYDVVQNVSRKELSGETKSLINPLLASFNTPTWTKAFSKMNLNISKDKYVVAQVIQGLIEEERNLGNPNRLGVANIYADKNVTELHSNDYYDKATDDYVLKVNGDEDQREDDILSANYISTVISNLILRYNGDINKAIMAYHITPEAMDILLGRADGTWSHRNPEEIYQIAKDYGGLNEPNLNHRIVEDALSYVNSTEGQQDIANTSTKWYQEIFKKAKNLTQGIVDSADNLLDKMFGDLYKSKENKGIVYFKNYKSHDDYVKIMQRIMGLKKKEPFEEVSWELFDFFTGGSGNGLTLMTQGVSATGTLQQFGGLIYNIDTYVTPLNIETPPINSAYGWRLHPKLKIWRMHNGLDVRMAGGTPIVSIADGKVTASGWLGDYGYAVKIAHPISEGNYNEYITSIYAHMNKPPLVKVGHQVKAGQTIGYVGTTGNSTGNHLHFEIEPKISPSNPNYSQWSQYMNKDGRPTINPFYFITANPTPEQIAKYSITIPRH